MKVLYIEGDACAVKYVRGAMEQSGLTVAMRAADTPPTQGLEEADVIAVSDVTAARLGPAALAAIATAAERGTGLLVVGGWSSYGRGGWAGTALAEALPVDIADGDDREHVPGGAWLQPATGLPRALADLPWTTPPVVTGWNRIAPKPGARVALASMRLRLREDRARSEPILVLGSHGDGRIAALATDLAPHWSGGWTDWGLRHVAVSEGEELGWAYIAFVGRLVRWLGGEELAGASPDAERAVSR